MGSSDRSRQDADPGDLPQPPYPDAVGHPLTHSVRTMRDPLAFRDAALRTHDVARYHLFGVGDVYNLTHPSHFRRVLATDRASFGKSDDFRVAFGDGLVATEGSQWRQQRELLQPLFAQGRIDAYVDRMVDQIRRRTDAWSDGAAVDLQREMRRLTLDVLFATLFGRELDLGGDEAIHRAATHLHDWFSPTSYPLPQWVPTPARRRFKRGRAKLRTIADRLLAETADGPRPTGDEPADLLSVLAGLRESEDGPALSDAELRDQVVTLVFAGHDTTASALALALYELARHESVRERFHEEVDDLSTPIGRASLDELTVTERIVRETLRLYPPVYVLPRETERAVAIDGYQVPQGVPVWLGIRQVHRDDRFYDAPDEFRPSRWAADAAADAPEFAYAPFGGGPRLCIGRQFALTEAKLALAIVGRNYRLTRADTAGAGDTTRPDPPLTADMTLRLTPGTEFYVSDR